MGQLASIVDQTTIDLFRLLSSLLPAESSQSRRVIRVFGIKKNHSRQEEYPAFERLRSMKVIIT